jgi:3-hydroxybutyryl-CoA dehydratase
MGTGFRMEDNRMMVIQRGLYFEEYINGVTITSSGRTITEADVVAFAGLTGDWSRLHTDAVYAAQTPFGQRIAHGLLGLSIATSLALRMGFLEETLLAFREINNWKFVLPIFLGDTIHMQAKVHETRPVPRMNGGMVILDIEVLNQDDKVIQRGSWSVLVKSKPSS